MKIYEGSIFWVREALCYVTRIDGVIRIEEITKKYETKEGWFQDGEQKEVELTQKWLDILSELDNNARWKKEIYDIESDYHKRCSYKSLNEFLFSEYWMKSLYEYSVKQSQTNISPHIYISAKMRYTFFDAICDEFEP